MSAITPRSSQKADTKLVNMTVSPQQRETYTAIIDQIVAASDLNTVSVNQIREGLQERVDHDLAPQKV
jgi:upstream activation factor subunit UAF30